MSGGKLNYGPRYNEKVIRNLIRSEIRRLGLVRASVDLAVQTLHNIRATLYYSLPRRFFTFGDIKLPLCGVECLLFRPNLMIPQWYRAANVLSKFASERSVEIPIANHFLRARPWNTFLEVGNVMSYYYSVPTHDIVDKYETWPGIINCDIMDFDPPRKYDVIISISTLEHVGFDERQRDPDKARRAVEKLPSLLAANGRALVTVPVGYNPSIDNFLDNAGPSSWKVRYISRKGRSLMWEMTSSAKVGSHGQSLAVITRGDYPG